MPYANNRHKLYYVYCEDAQSAPLLFAALIVKYVWLLCPKFQDSR